MIVTLNFQTFQSLYMNQMVFVKETDTSWEMWATQELYHVRCNVEKDQDSEKNIMFVERYFADRKNIVKVIDIIQEDKEEEADETVPTESDEALPIPAEVEEEETDKETDGTEVVEVENDLEQ